MSSNLAEKLFVLLACVAMCSILFLAVVAIEQTSLNVIHKSQIDGCRRGDVFKALLSKDLHIVIPQIDCVKTYPPYNAL